jgi:ATP-dependent Clp protease adaptor protein ClpS
MGLYNGGVGDKGTKHEGGVLEKTREKTQTPKLYKVLLHNDDYTTMEFVLLVLETVFNKSPAEAHRVMMHVHTTGLGVAGVYSHEVAETKVALTEEAAKDAGHPLRCSLEPE